MIDVGLFRLRTFNAALTVNFLAIFVLVGYFLFVARYLQLVVGLSPPVAGPWSLPSTVAFIVGFQTGAADRAARAAGVPDRRGTVRRRAGARDARRRGGDERPAAADRGVGGDLHRPGAGLRPDHRADRGDRAAGARRRRRAGAPRRGLAARAVPRRAGRARGAVTGAGAALEPPGSRRPA